MARESEAGNEKESSFVARVELSCRRTFKGLKTGFDTTYCYGVRPQKFYRGIFAVLSRLLRREA